MRVAWVHPTWRDLVIERLAGDAELRRHFLGRCGPHGVVLALSTGGGAAGERVLPLVVGDEDWDALGDRIHAIVPELDHIELAALLMALRGLVATVNLDGRAAGEGRALARMALERTAATWAATGTAVPLDCLDAWLSLSRALDPPVWPDFLEPTWSQLLPTTLPYPEETARVRRFTDWATLCRLVQGFSPDLLEQLGFGPHEEWLLHNFRDETATDPRGGSSDPTSIYAEDDVSRGRHMADSVVRRVLADL